ncbi:MAG: aminodeoxychorismate lyase, partial [Clostridiales bacterium]|nr:aminodeoxychorismate lyase [Clostridiales bacterium]
MAETTKKPKQRKHHRKRRGLFIFVVFVILCGIGFSCAAFSYKYVMDSYNDSSISEEVQVPADEAVEFTIPKGANTTEIAGLLEEKGFIKNINLYKLLSKLNGYDGRYQS